MLKIIARSGKDSLAQVYVAENEKGFKTEFAHSLQPPFPRNKKWVFLISTLYGCPIRCSFCDAGGSYLGRLSKEEMLFQIKYLYSLFYKKGFSCEKLKIQFARVGEPSFNPAVIDVLKELPLTTQNSKVFPSISTVAPQKTEKFFERLIEIKKNIYPLNFQLQFSIHSSQEDFRDKIMPFPKWSLKKIADYGKEFFDKNGRKITLNFIYNPNFPCDPQKLSLIFSKDIFLFKITPVNPTFNALSKGLCSDFSWPNNVWFEILKNEGYEIIVSEGEKEENLIGSNCGQYISSLKSYNAQKSSYTYPLIFIER